MSLGFVSGTLSCFIFQQGVPAFFFLRTEDDMADDMAGDSAGERPVVAGSQPAAWPRLAMATPGPGLGLGRLQPAAAGARALLVVHGHGGAYSETL